jgi:hypothetical protein
MAPAAAHVCAKVIEMDIQRVCVSLMVHAPTCLIRCAKARKRCHVLVGPPNRAAPSHLPRQQQPQSVHRHDAVRHRELAFLRQVAHRPPDLGDLEAQACGEAGRLSQDRQQRRDRSVAGRARGAELCAYWGGREGGREGAGVSAAAAVPHPERTGAAVHAHPVVQAIDTRNYYPQLLEGTHTVLSLIGIRR